MSLQSWGEAPIVVPAEGVGGQCSQLPNEALRAEAPPRGHWGAFQTRQQGSEPASRLRPRLQRKPGRGPALGQVGLCPGTRVPPSSLCPQGPSPEGTRTVLPLRMCDCGPLCPWPGWQGGPFRALRGQFAVAGGEGWTQGHSRARPHLKATKVAGTVSFRARQASIAKPPRLPP